MAQLVAGFGSSHSVMLTAGLDDWLGRFADRDPALPYFDRNGVRRPYDYFLSQAPADGADRITPEAITRRYEEATSAMERMRQAVAAARLDALIILGDDQEELFHDTNMPAISIYYGNSIRNAARPDKPSEDWYVRAQMRRREDGRDVEYPCHGALARHLIEGLTEREFDISGMSTLPDGLSEGHAISFVHRHYMKPGVVPVVPVLINTFYPPNQPTPRRCLALGKAIGDLVRAFPDNIRVGIMASGGLSHFIVEEDLDRLVIDLLRNKDMERLADLSPNRLKAGSSEIRNWICLAGAAGGLDLSWVSYIPGYRSPALTGTGLCFAQWA